MIKIDIEKVERVDGQVMSVIVFIPGPGIEVHFRRNKNSKIVETCRFKRYTSRMEKSGIWIETKTYSKMKSQIYGIFYQKKSQNKEK